MTSNLLLITFLWQFGTAALLVAFDNGTWSVLPDHLPAKEQVLTVDLSIGAMILGQTLHLILIIVISIKLTKQVFHKTVSGWFLCQSYGSIILLFDGIYNLMYNSSYKFNYFSYRLDSTSFAGIPENLMSKDLRYFDLFIRFAYFSASTMTSTGFGDVHAVTLPAVVVVTLQMLLSVLFTTVILSKGLSHFSESTPAMITRQIQHE